MRSIKTILLSLAAALLVSCGTTKTVPITGRQQSLMVSDGDVLSLSNQQYQEFMKTAKLSTNAQTLYQRRKHCDGETGGAEPGHCSD